MVFKVPIEGNTGSVDLGLSTVEGDQVQDENLAVAFFEATNPQRAILRAAGLSYPPKPRFVVPAFPQSGEMVLEAAPSRFRLMRSGAFRLHDHEIARIEFTAYRTPSEWSAVFDPWTQLPVEFDPLRAVLKNSPRLAIRGGRTFNLLTEGNYDSVAAKVEVFAKTSLLNLYTRLTMTAEPTGSNKSWFSFVSRIIEIGRERLIAIVDPKMGELVRKVKNNISHFKEYKNTPAGNHFGNIPSEYRAKKGDMFSVKTKEDLGNLQLTLAPAVSSDGEQLLLLDADIDENGKLMLHLADVFKHKFTGGTHPFDIHEYLAWKYKGRRLGYRLV